MRASESYTVVLGGNHLSVHVDPCHCDARYKVYVNGKHVAMLRREGPNKRFICEHLETNHIFPGRTRNKAVTSMIYTLYK